jgi:hypothetical protein
VLKFVYKSGVVVKLFKNFKKFITTVILLFLLIFVVTFFDSFYAKYDFRALATYKVTKNDAVDIPSDINFIQDDKKVFIKYCQKPIITNQPLIVDDKTYVYYGNRNGYRFYRMSITAMPYTNINSELTIDGYTFESCYTLKPYATGLYIIGNSGVFTLEEAYNNKIIDIKRIYDLYMAKNLIS